MELDVPFVGASSLTTYPIPLMHHHLQLLGHGSPFAVIPDEIKAKVAAYGKGMMSSRTYAHITAIVKIWWDPVAEEDR